LQKVAPGTSGNVLTSDGTTWASTTPPSAPVSSVNSQTGAVVTTDAGSIGCTMILMYSSTTNINQGATCAGSILYQNGSNNGNTLAWLANGYSWSAGRWTNNSSYGGGGTAMTGTWRKMSQGSSVIAEVICGTTYYSYIPTMFVRIS
jgi:hypothetical protein